MSEDGKRGKFDWRDVFKLERVMEAFQYFVGYAISIWQKHGVPFVESLLLWPILAHVALIVSVTWLVGWLGLNPILSVLMSVLMLHKVLILHLEREAQKIRVNAYREKFLSERSTPDDETTRWINLVLHRAWPLWLERTISQKITPKLVPWFLNSYKPSIIRKITLKSVNLGSNPPVVTSVRAFNSATGGNHVEMELCLEVASASDMFMKFVAKLGSTSWAGLGLIPWEAYVTDLQMSGQARVSIRFAGGFPYMENISLSFVDEPKVSFSLKVLGMGMGKGFDTSGLPVVADYMKSTLQKALTTSLVAPNKLVIDDVLTFLGDVFEGVYNPPATPTLPEVVSPGAADEILREEVKANQKTAVATAFVEILGASQLKKADWNGLSDPYVKGYYGLFKFCTSVKKNTLNPKWNEAFKISIKEWEEGAKLRLRVMDYDRFSSDDDLGVCYVDFCDYLDGKRHEITKDLEGVRTGKLILALTILDETKVLTDEVPTLKMMDDGTAMADVTVGQNVQQGLRSDGFDPHSKMKRRSISLKDENRKIVSPGCVVISWDL